MNREQTFSHKQVRTFQPEKLSAPRDFFIPKVIQNVATKKTAYKNTVIKDDGDELPLILEIGAGKGKHALSFAAAHPEKHLIAIERTRNKFEAFTKLFDQQQMDNLTPIHADAIAWTVHAIPPESLTSIYLLYPNPEQHNPNQQWLNMPFFEFLLSRLQVGGEVILATNIESYIDNAEQQAASIWQLPNSRHQVPHDSQRTHFEVKYLARGETCWQLTMTKPEGYETRFDSWYAEVDSAANKNSLSK